MGKKDTYTRPFMANKERFAELINVHIYQGRDFVKPEMLKRLRGGYPALSSATEEKVRDILMEQENPRMRYGMELETGIDYGMRECAGRFIRDYGIQVVEADFVNPEDYRTDLKEFFMALQCRNDGKKLRALLQSDEFQHLEHETEMAIAVNLNLKPIITKMEEEEISMCKAFEELMIEQEELGMEKGMEKGDAVRIIKSVDHVIDNLKVTLAEACGIIGVTPEEFEKAKALS